MSIGADDERLVSLGVPPSGKRSFAGWNGHRNFPVKIIAMVN